MDKKDYKPNTEGHIHPVNVVVDKMVQIFTEMGYEIALGPEVEDEYHNFDALNIPADHPARDMQDTFWLKGDEKKVLRTHTSPVQIRYMEKNKPPFKIIVPGKVYRFEATDRTHEVMFHQIEGLVVGKDISVANLKFTLNNFLKKLFGDAVVTRFRPSFFPFVEPGFEVDMQCVRCKGAGCTTCKGTGWVEILGAGMVHPKELLNLKINPEEFQGFAFGLGLDRIVMNFYGIDDIRLLYSGDIRLTGQI